MTDKPIDRSEIFTFGDPVPVLDGRGIYDYLEVGLVGDRYEPPVHPDHLAKALGSNTHHASAIQVKSGILSSCFKPSPILSRESFRRAALEYLVFGNAYLQVQRNRGGGLMALKTVPAKMMRRLKGQGEYEMLMPGGADSHKFKANSIIHLKEVDINQEVYGVPGYLAALQSAFLNEAATLFRRKYYLNGSHAGFILHVSDAVQDHQDIDNVRKALKDAKGPGNFRNLFMYMPGGKADGIKVIPLAEVAAKDEFLNIKNVTRDDVLAAHRVPPPLMGIVPNNTGGFGNVESAARVFSRNELDPLKAIFLAVNDQLGRDIITFDDYVIDGSA